MYHLQILGNNAGFETHTSSMKAMKAKTIGKIKLLGRVRNIIDRETALLLYECLIIPIYDYCDYVYFPLGAKSIEVLRK